MPRASSRSDVFCPVCGTLCYPVDDSLACANLGCDWQEPLSAEQEQAAKTEPETAPPTEGGLGRPAAQEPASGIHTPNKTSPKQPEPQASAPPAAPRPAPPPGKPAPKKRRGVVRFGVLGMIGLALGFWLASYQSFSARVDRALAANKVLGSDSAASLYRTRRAQSPHAPDLQEAARKIRARIEPYGQDAYAKWYAGSLAPNWGQVADVYQLLSEMDGGGAEERARQKYALAQTYFDARDFGQAMALYDEALVHKPGWVLPINGRAKLFVRSDSPFYAPEKGVQTFKEAIAADPAFVWAYKNLGEFYRQQKNWEEAVRFLSAAARLSPSPAVAASLKDARAKLEAQQKPRKRR